MLADNKKSMEYGQINWLRIVPKSKPSPKILPFRSPMFLKGFLELILSTEGQSYEVRPVLNLKKKMKTEK